MRIKNFYPSNSLENIGLSISPMKNLSQIVALFGKNGAGKTRLLDSIPNEINSKVHEIIPVKNNLLDFERMMKIQPLTHDQKILFEHNQKLWNDFKENYFGGIQNTSVIEIHPNSYAINDSLNMQDSDYRAMALDLTSNPSYDKVKQNCAKFIKAIIKSELSKEYHGKNPEKSFYRLHDEIQEKNVKLLHFLIKVVNEIMNKNLEYATDEHLTPILILDNRRLEIRDLSPGEQDLLAFCVFLVLQSQEQIANETVTLKDKILIIDEPDLFLHPKAQIDLLQGLRRLIGDGQIWIATHSISLLSVLNRDEIWLMEDGKITSPSIETPNKVLTSLIGEDNIDRLENFISSQYEWASIQFALECLFPPSVSNNKKDDPQQEQIIQILTTPKQELKILDFGAGKGRIALELLRNKHILPNIYYQALEIDKVHHSQLKEITSTLQTFSNIENEKEREILDNYLKLNEPQYKDFFDFVLLINVLHEIPINKWQCELNSILHSLKENGKLIILEDQAIPKGENAHEFGFIILDIDEFKFLFSLDNNPISYKHPELKYTERLTCIEINKTKSQVTPESISQALHRKKTNCNTAIQSLREKQNKTSRDGRMNSYLTQLYANVDMAYNEINTETK